MTASRRTLLVVNLHFAPNSFGGATIVAENMADQLGRHHPWRVIVVTAHQGLGARPYSMLRYTTGKVEVFSIAVPDEGALNYTDRYLNSNFALAFESIISRLHIDVAHIHSIQNMGIGIISALYERGIPIATTVHDCWWFCERMFMIDVRGRYCHQRKIDMDVCRYCVISVNDAIQRNSALFSALCKSKLLLFPSRFHREMYVDNGFPEEKCIVNKNGTRMPGPDYENKRTKRRREGEKDSVVFGFVGGPGDIKGAPLIKRAFSELPYSNYELHIVDGARNRGLSWAKSFNWRLPGKIKLIPPYNRDTMDDFFASIDVLLFPSQWKESFGLTVREAIARGVWVIATDAGGVAEDCVEGMNADIIPLDGDHITLKRCIEAILEKGVVPPVRMKAVVSETQQAEELNTLLEKLLAEASVS